MNQVLESESTRVDHEVGPATAEVPIPGESTRRTALPAYLVATGVYLAVSLFIWWHLWVRGLRTTTVCGCGDPSLFTWFLAWPAHAILHLQNPFYSTAIFHPGGVNLLSNTSELGIGIPLAPVTWLFGPIATLNVALILCPVACGLSMFALLRRWVAWKPAAFIGGLAYGFAPILILNLTGAWFMISMAAVPPLILICLDELLIRQRRRPIRMGVVLGLLVTYQFFIGTEQLLITAISALVGIVIVVAYAAAVHRDALRSRLRHGAVGIASGTVTSLVLLAYPVWFALAGPAHLSGKIWPSSNLQYAGIKVHRVLFPTPPDTTGAFGGLKFFERAGGFLGPSLSFEYVGLGLFAVVIVGIVAFRRDRRLWLFGVMSLVTLVLSLGASKSVPLPWAPLAALPQFENVIPARFLVVTWLFLAILVALIVDHVHATVDRWRLTRVAKNKLEQGRTRFVPPAWSAGLVASLVALVALVQPAAYEAQDVPMTTQKVEIPKWFRTVGPHLDARQVVLVLPAPSSLIESAAVWQAVEGFNYSLVEGPGPGGYVGRAGPETPGARMIDSASLFLGENVVYDGATLRRSLRGWGVTTIVIPDQPELPLYLQITSVTLAAALIASATGQRPVFEAGAWVWNDVAHMGDAPAPSQSQLLSCVDGAPTHGAAAVDAATNCVLGSSTTPH